MGRRGPAAKPSRLKLLHGNPGKRPISEHEPRPSADMPPCPQWLNQKARLEWDRVLKAMPAGVITAVDFGVLAAYCQALAEFSEATEHCKGLENHWIATDKGNLVLHPASLVLQRACERMVRLGVQLGLTPSARVGLEVKQSDPTNPLMRFLNGQKVG